MLTSSLHGHSCNQGGTAPWRGFEKCVELLGHANKNRIEANCCITMQCSNQSIAVVVTMLQQRVFFVLSMYAVCVILW